MNDNPNVNPPAYPDPEDRRAYLAWLASEGMADDTELAEIQSLSASDADWLTLVASERALSRHLSAATALPMADSLADLAAATVARQQRLRWLWRGAVAGGSALAAGLALAFILRSPAPSLPVAPAGVLTVTGPVAQAAAGAPIFDLTISPPPTQLAAARASHTIRPLPLLISTATLPEPSPSLTD
jgi:hypothetical protein